MVGEGKEGWKSPETSFAKSLHSKLMKSRVLSKFQASKAFNSPLSLKGYQPSSTQAADAGKQLHITFNWGRLKPAEHPPSWEVGFRHDGDAA